VQHTDFARRARRRTVAVGVSLALSALLVVAVAGPAAATAFQNTGLITIPAAGTGPAQSNPYPSTIAVSGLTGSVVDVNVTLNGITHTFPDDIDVLLVGPFGQNVVLMADSGGSNDITGVNLTFDDSASSSLPDSTQIVAGTYKPTNHGAFSGTSPAPAGPYGSALSIFNGTNPNGTWSLYVYDDEVADTGSISGGWSLDITTNGPTITSFNPTSGGPGASVVVTGTNFTGATSVTFGGVGATTFTVNSATQITATVPAGAVTGPIAVTTPNGTATSSTSFTVIPAPTITSFSPTSGKVGTSVVIAGTTFTGATAVKFDGTAASAFTVNSGTQITATVPAGASTGPISVTTPSGTGTSSADFVVKHARSISLDVGRKARGQVSVTDGFSACASEVPVRIQHFDAGTGRWKTVASALTKANGSYTAGGVADSGKYRAIAKKTTLPTGDKCLKATSPVAHQ
jgi:subtilisin-like proprotein convertase family protein